MNQLLSLRIIFSIFIYLSLPHSSILAINDEKTFKSVVVDNPQGQELQTGYYVVVGSFNIYENAQRWTKDLEKKGYSSNFVFSDKHHRYYVYMHFSSTLSEGREKLYKVREIEIFKDAWILRISTNLAESSLNENSSEFKNDVVSEAKGEPNAGNLEKDVKKNHNNNKKDLSKTHNSYLVFINPVGPDNKSIPSLIKVADGEKAILLKTIESQKDEVIFCPKSYSQVVEFICENIVGYRKKVLYVDLSNPVNDTTNIYVQKVEDRIIINLPLDPLQKGDIMTMYNVFFFPNTNILRIKSNYELQKLLEMLNSNPNLKVMIHGHVNGNSYGPITRVQEDAEDLFNPNETVVMNASSKKLSELRAETIRYYLINHGIAADRLQTEGWGGKKMLHKEDSPLAEYNVRVEIEILEN